LEEECRRVWTNVTDELEKAMGGGYCLTAAEGLSALTGTFWLAK